MLPAWVERTRTSGGTPAGVCRLRSRRLTTRESTLKESTSRWWVLLMLGILLVLLVFVLHVSM
jgi:hypothetical protein